MKPYIRIRVFITVLLLCLIFLLLSWGSFAADKKTDPGRSWTKEPKDRYEKYSAVKLPDEVIKFRHLSQDALDGIREYLSPFFLEGPGGISGPPLCFGSTCVDLVPVVVRDDSDQDCSFCQRVVVNGQVGLEVSIRNQGLVGANASATTTSVSYDPGGVISVPTPGLPAGYSVDLHHLQFIPIPDVCRTGNCEIIICADSNDDIAELNEDNNCVTCFFVP